MAHTLRQRIRDVNLNDKNMNRWKKKKSHMRSKYLFSVLSLELNRVSLYLGLSETISFVSMLQYLEQSR